MQLKPKIKDTTHVLPLQNGIDIHERVRAIIKNGVVYPACVYVGTHIERPGKVTQRGGSCTILFGEGPENACASPKDICELFDVSKIKYKWCDDPFAEIWKKYMFIAAYGMVTASEDKTLGQVRDSKELSDKVIGIMKEINAIAKKKGINLPDNIVEASFDNGRNFQYENRTSFQRDFMQKNKPNESGLFGDTIIKTGNMMGVLTPVSKAVDEKLKRVKLSE